MKLSFKKATSSQQVEDIYQYTTDAFSDSPDFAWNIDEIRNEVKDGWDLYGAYLGEEVIAAVFLKKEKTKLVTKATAIKMNYQGSGYSHKIKEFIEDQAQSAKVQEIVNYCGIDNFRMYSLNESHGYEKTDRRLGDKGQVVEWIKKLKK